MQFVKPFLENNLQGLEGIRFVGEMSEKVSQMREKTERRKKGLKDEVTSILFFASCDKYAHSGVVIAFLRLGAAALSCTVHFHVLEPGLFKPTPYIISFEAHPAVIVLDPQEFKVVLLHICDYQLPARLQDPYHLFDRLRRGFDMMETHVGKGIVHRIIGKGQFFCLAHPAVNLPNLDKSLSQFFQHRLGLVNGYDLYPFVDQSLGDKSCACTDIGRCLSFLHAGGGESCVPDRRGIEASPHLFPLMGGFIKILLTVHEILMLQCL